MEILLEPTSNKLMVASDTLIDFQIKFSISIGETVTHWFTLITLSALRRFDNENTLSLMNLILRLGDARKVFDEMLVKDTCKGSGSKLGAPVSRLSGNCDSDVDSSAEVVESVVMAPKVRIFSANGDNDGVKDECIFYGDDSSCIKSDEISFDLGSSAEIVSCSGNDIDIETNSRCDHKTHSFSGDEGEDISDIEELKCLNGSMRCSIPAESIEDEGCI
uniref:Uncharacterized protein n=1 Tax=Tanacetum cinerariifolium TaxID=118510 RepID=A0A6L2P6M9_TANCI|nr:hypothetical protein [Tanacetum cinerariifolium]